MGGMAGGFVFGRYHMRRLFCVAALSALMVGLVISLASPVQRTALADTGVEVTDKCRLSSDELRINVLVLLDASKSLVRTDPQNARRDGLEAAVRNLADLAESSPDVGIYVAVDTFATRYERRHGWLDAAGTKQALQGSYASITALPGAGVRTLTDYRQAMQGAAERFGSAEGSCNLLLWFTDGEHATWGTSSDVSEAEWEELRELCMSSDMAQLAEQGIWTLAVLLDSDSSPVSADPLRQLFGEGSTSCRHALNGDIRSDISAADLSNALGELTAEIVWESETQANTADDLPNEIDGPPAKEDYQPCSGGDATVERPCEYQFRLDDEIDSFRVFVDMTYLNQNINNPEAINMVLRAPSGQMSEPILSAGTAGTAEAIRYSPVLPFWFLSHRPYDSRWEIIGHQAASQLASETGWEWEGEWSLLFWGETPEAVSDARKVAAAFRDVNSVAPSADMSVSSEDLVGYIANFPQEYASAELRLRLDDSNANPVYPTRPYLRCRQQVQCDPLLVSAADEGRRFGVSEVYEEIFWWDSAAAGGNESARAAASDGGGPVVAVAVLEQEFFYGGADGYGPDGQQGQPLSWVRDIGQVELDLQGPIADAAEISGAKDKWEALQDDVKQLQSGQMALLAGGLELHEPPYDTDENRVVFRVRVEPGYFPSMVTLSDARLRSDGEQELAGMPRYDRAWLCSVSGTWDESSEPSQPADCGAIRMDLGLSEDSTVLVEMDFGIALDRDLQEFEQQMRSSIGYSGTWDEWSPPSEEWAELWEAIGSVASPQMESVQSLPFYVDLPTTGDKLSKFWPILFGLVGLAFLLRVLAAWRLRPWVPLSSPDYIVRYFNSSDEQLLDSVQVTEPGRELCMELNRRSASAQVGGVLLFSMWKPLLLGGPPRLAAKSSGSRCMGASGAMRTRRQARRNEGTGLGGHGLEDGWMVEISATGDRLIVWDLPNDEVEARERLLKAEGEANYQMEQLAAEASAQDSAAGPNVADATPKASGGTTAAGGAAVDPFGDTTRSDPFGDL